MPKSSVTFSNFQDPCYTLIKTMNKAEKRVFRLYVNRLEHNEKGQPLFLQLFEAMDQQREYNESQLKIKLKNIKSGQFSNLKRHLYQQILTALRLVHIDKHADISVREQLDFARILYSKGLYLQGLKVLERAAEKTQKLHQDILRLEVLEFQKLIEERHITRSRQEKNKMDNLVARAELLSHNIYNSSRLSNLKIQIHGYYIKMGHVKNDADEKIIRDYWKSQYPKDLDPNHLNFFDQVFLYQSKVWYHYILLEFEQCLENARAWTNKYESRADLIHEDPELYLRGLHYVLTCLFYMQQSSAYELELLRFESFVKAHVHEFNATSAQLAFIYLNLGRLNHYFLNGQFKTGLQLVPVVESGLSIYAPNLDIHRVMVFYFKLAWMYFGAGDILNSLEYLNKIIQLKAGHLREDIQAYARLLHLILHLELGHFDLLEYLLPSVERFLEKEKVRELNKMQMAVLRFIKEMVLKRKMSDASGFKKFRLQLEQIQKDRFEARSFLYLDIFAWVDSKIENMPIEWVVSKRG